MKEQKGMKWQILLVILILGVDIAAFMFSRVEITGDKYVGFAVEVNRKAEELNASIARPAGATEVINSFERGTSRREEEAKKYQQIIDEKCGEGKASMTGYEFANWLIRTGGYFEEAGIHLKERSAVAQSGVLVRFRIVGFLMYLSPVVAFITIIVVLVRRKTERLLLLLNGILVAGMDVAWYLYIPKWFQEKMTGCIDSLDMIDSRLFEIKGVEEFFFEKGFQTFVSEGFYMHFIVGVMTILSVLALFTICRPNRFYYYEYVEMPDASEVTDAEEKVNWDEVDRIEEKGPPDQSLIEEMKEKRRTNRESRGETKRLEIKPKDEETKEILPMADQMGAAPVAGAAPLADSSGMGVSQSTPVETIFPIDMSLKGYFHGLKGQFAGDDFEFDGDTEIVLGSDSEKCDFVFYHPKVGKRHCGVTFDSTTGQYKVIAYTTADTILSNGKHARTDSYVTAQPGTVLCIGDGTQMIRLG